MARMHRTALGIMLASTLLLSASVLQAQEKIPDGKISVKTTAIAFLAGAEWGKGTLEYQGKTYPFKVHGIKAGSIGIKSGAMSGHVYNLKKLEDFDGKYVAAEASITIAGGVGASSLSNQNQVVLNITEVSGGFDVTLAAKGMTFKLEK